MLWKGVAALVFCLVGFVADDASAATYHVSYAGSDDNSGLTPAAPWRTLARVNAQTLLPGDSVLLRRGDAWREELVVSSSGTDAAYVSFGAYGEGDRPRILGSVAVSTWTTTGIPNVWRSSSTVADPWTVITASGTNCQIFFVERDGPITWGYHEAYDASLSALSSEYDWTWNAGYLYVHAPSDPGQRYVTVEAPQRQNGVLIEHQQYVAFDSLEIAYLGAVGIRDAYPPATLSGLRVTNCHIHHIGRKGSNVAYGTYNSHGSAYYAGNEIHDCGRRSISVAAVSYSTQVVVQGIVIEGNHFHHGFHTTGVDITPSGAGGHVITGVVIRDNLFEGHPEVFLRGGDRTDLTYDDGLNTNHIFIANQNDGGLGGMTDILVARNTFTFASGKSIGLENVENARVYHNTFYGVNPTLANTQAHVYVAEGNGTPRDITIKNNIFLNDMNHAFNPGFVSIKVDANWASEITVDNNLYFSTDPANVLVWIRGRSIDGVWIEGGEYTTADWNSYRSTWGWDTGSPTPADPLFAFPAAGNFGLTSGSPAVDKGVRLPGLNDGYQGTAPDLGAFELSPVLLSIGEASIVEGNAGGKTLTFDVELTSPGSSVTAPAAEGK